MYKIMLLVREGRPYWTPYMVSSEVEVSPPVIDSDSGEVITPAVIETQDIEYATDSMDELEKTVMELLKSYTTGQLKIIEDVTYTLDIIFA